MLNTMDSTNPRIGNAKTGTFPPVLNESVNAGIISIGKFVTSTGPLQGVLFAYPQLRDLLFASQSFGTPPCQNLTATVTFLITVCDEQFTPKVSVKVNSKFAPFPLMKDGKFHAGRLNVLAITQI